jgi:hypothetical protein
VAKRVTCLYCTPLDVEDEDTVACVPQKPSVAFAGFSNQVILSIRFAIHQVSVAPEGAPQDRDLHVRQGGTVSAYLYRLKGNNNLDVTALSKPRAIAGACRFNPVPNFYFPW